MEDSTIAEKDFVGRAIGMKYSQRQRITTLVPFRFPPSRPALAVLEVAFQLPVLLQLIRLRLPDIVNYDTLVRRATAILRTKFLFLTINSKL